MKRKLILLTVAALGCAVPALAILGIGDIVFDPSNFQEAVQHLVQLERQYDQLVRTYQKIDSQYQHMLWMAKSVPAGLIARYRALPTLWRYSSASNVFGTTGGWINGINTGQDVFGGYSNAIEALNTYGNAFANIPIDQQDRIRTSYATVELTDGVNRAGMQTLGELRGNAPAVEAAIQSLEDDSLSTDPELNTEVSVLNKINAANVINVRNTQDTNKLLVALAEEQIVQAKRVRDAEARAFNDHIRFVSEAQPIMAAQAANASSAMLAWQMP